MKIFKSIACITVVLAILVACDIKEDIPYPIVHGQISEFEVEGQCGADGSEQFQTQIDKEKKQVTLYVNDTVDLKKIRIKKITATGTTFNPDVEYMDSPSINPDSKACADYENFPKTSFSNPSRSQNTIVDFTKPVKFIIRTYQDYEWTVTITQVVKREIEVENQVGKAIIDHNLCNAVIYVSKEQSLKELKVTKFSIGGENGIVHPDPTEMEHIDFRQTRKFVVLTGWKETQIWYVSVYHTESAVETTAKVLARNYNATISGEKPNNSTPIIEYKELSKNNWTKVADNDIQSTSTTYTATIKGLKPATKYQYKVKAGESSVDVQEFTTVQLQDLPNSSFDDWSTDANNPKLYCPWAAGNSSFWDTGNRGATTVGNSNSVPTEDTSTGSGRAAYLESKWIVIKFAAGNIFTGTYLKTDGTNGILGFGRPFSAFPSKLSFDYKYKSMPIDKIDKNSNLADLKGKPDSCNIYIALWHLEEDEYEDFQGEKYPLIIRTKPGLEQHLFTAEDPRVIAYGQFTQGNSVEQWTSETITINYKNTELTPTHILVVASSSKYGDFFTGGVGSTLVLDNMKLIYE